MKKIPPSTTQIFSFLTREYANIERVIATGEKYASLHSFLPSISCKRFSVIPLTSV